jgi:hypothetical protein
MNPRIKELMEQASAGACYDDYPTNSLIGTEIERFAELIVQECAQYMYEHFPETKYKVDYMRKHMGDPNWCELLGVVK